MDQIYYIQQQKTKGNETTESLLIAFSTYEKAQEYLEEYAENMGYETRYSEEGNLMYAKFKNPRRNVNILLTIQILQVH